MGEYENVGLSEVYEHILHIEKRLERLEDILEIPTVQLSESKLKKYKSTLKRMLEGTEGVSLEAYKAGKH